jgi:cytochrome c peroxidase
MPSFTIRHLLFLIVLVWAAVMPGVAAPQGGATAPVLTVREQLGKLLFFDPALSAGGNQSCASCHAPEAGWVGGTEAFNRTGGIYEGSIGGRFGNRKPPSAAYATFAPALQLTASHHGGCPHCAMMSHAMGGGFVGGNFWDGRATGEKLGSPAADQAMGPFLNPLEQAVPDARTLVDKVCAGPYAQMFQQVWGASACGNADEGYRAIALSIAAYEGSREVNQFSSKYDAYLAGRAQLTPEETRGLQLFAGKGRCATCHPYRASGSTPPLFTDFTFDNLGVPANPDNPFYFSAASNPQGRQWRDEGLGGYLATTTQHASSATSQLGKHRVPTLRNVDLRPRPTFVKAYGHNGYFKSLEAIVHFYNTRDVLPACAGEGPRPGIDCWPQPEVAANVNRGQLGRLRLSPEEEAAIVAFLRTLSDGYAGVPPTAAGATRE